MLKLDPVLFEQVLFNLLDNAAKYTPAGGASPHRGAARWQRIVHLRIMDEGDGIPPADLERIFDKFYRVQAARPQTRRHRPRPCHLPRLRRGDGRHDHRGKPRAIARGAVFTITLPVPAASTAEQAA